MTDGGVHDVEVGEDQTIKFTGRVICVRHASRTDGTLDVNVTNGVLPVNVSSSVKLDVEVKNDADNAIPVNISKIDNKKVGIT